MYIFKIIFPELLQKLENQPERPVWITVICLQRLHWRCLYQERKGMKCLCCGKPITNSATNVEKEWCWHKKCVKRFFQTEELPILDITKEQLLFAKGNGAW